MFDSALEQLSSLREQPRKMINSVDQNFEGVKWEEKSHPKITNV